MALKDPVKGEMTDIVPAAKRGRPSKNAEVYDDNGYRICTSEQHEEINNIVSEIKSYSKKVLDLLVTAAEKYFRLGEILFEVNSKATCHMTAKRYEEKTGIPERMVYTAIKVYKNFANNPEAIKGMTMREIAMTIGEKKEGEKNEVKQLGYNIADLQDSNNSQEFELPTLSGVKLEKYRVHTDRQSGNLYLISRDFGGSIPIAKLTVAAPTDPTTEEAYGAFLEEVQKAAEFYYFICEREEKHA